MLNLVFGSLFLLRGLCSALWGGGGESIPFLDSSTAM